MSAANITLDTRQFQEAFRERLPHMSRTIAEELNQRAFNIAGRTVDAMKPAPGGEQAQRAKIRGYLNEPLSTRVRLATSGKRKGRFIKKGSRGNQLVRANLVIQARRAKNGLKGLHGASMRDAEGRFKLAAQVGVGFLKSPFLPIIKGLHALVKFKRIATRWGRISVWPGSDGYGKVVTAKPDWNPFVAMQLRWNVPGAPTKVTRLILPHFQKAFDAEAQEMRRHTAAKLQKEVDKMNAR